jgi:xylulokinase
MSLYVGIDLGTSGIKAVLMDAEDRIRGEAAVPVAVSIPRLGWSEQDADLWVQAVFGCLDRIAADRPGDMGAVAGIGLSGQMLACLILDRELRPIRPAMLWNDQRALAECAELDRLAPDLGLRTNGAPDPGITAPKLMWLRRHEPRAFGRARMILLTKDYVRLALTGELASEPTDAGGTGLFDCAAGDWAADLCALAGWDARNLPPLTQPWAAAGQLRPALAARWGMRAGVAVAAGCGDNMGSTLGVGAVRPGDAVLTVGTSGVACIVDAAFHPGPGAAILTSAHAAPDTFLSMGVVMSATQSLDWTARMTGRSAADLAAGAAALAAAGQIADAPVFLPAITGIRTPLNRPDAQGRIDGLHPGVTPEMLAYATMEGVAFQFADCVEAQAGVGAVAERLAMVGGGSRSDLWVRLVATVLGRPVTLPEGAHVAGPTGAARLAAVAAGLPVGHLGRARPARAVIDPDPVLAGMLGTRRARFKALLPARGGGTAG